MSSKRLHLLEKKFVNPSGTGEEKMGKIEKFNTVVWSAGAGCHGNCGQTLHVEDGKMVKIEGDDGHPWNQGRSCPRALAMTQYM